MYPHPSPISGGTGYSSPHSSYNINQDQHSLSDQANIQEENNDSERRQITSPQGNQIRARLHRHFASSEQSELIELFANDFPLATSRSSASTKYSSNRSANERSADHSENVVDVNDAEESDNRRTISDFINRGGVTQRKRAGQIS